MEANLPEIGDKVRVKIDIADRGMKAMVRIRTFEGEIDFQITLQEVLDALAGTGIKHGINESLIQNVIDEKKWEHQFVAAEGTPAGVGEDSSFEFKFTTQKSLKPLISDDGKIDYKEVNIVDSVNKDDILVEKIPAKIGSQGINVFGEQFPGKYGKDLNILAGSGTYKIPGNENVIKAACDGIVFFNPKEMRIEIQKLYSIKSVDYSTGNVHVKSSIEISEDIKPGFSVTTPYNINVKGTVEQATVSCDGNLIVKEGIVGDSKQVVKVGGDIHSGYIRNQQIKCGGSVYAAAEIRGSFIESEDEIIVVKNDGIIIGGKITASNKITTATAGNLYNFPTELEVGINFEFKEKFLHKHELKNGVLKQMEDVRKKIDVINSKPPDLGSNAKLKTLKAQLQDDATHLERLLKDISEIEKDYYNISDPVIIINKTVFPGVIIKIKKAVFEVKEEMSHVKFYFNDDHVEFKPIK